MGKKNDISKKRKRSDEDDDIVGDDSEIQAEIEAVMAIRAEKESQHDNVENNLIQHQSSLQQSYNKEGLLKAIETIGIESLPFVETLHVEEFELSIQDENDDLEREVIDFKF